MGFLSPWFLLGLAGVALPLWLHLLRQFKRNPRAFSSLMFFERRIQSSTKHRRLRYIVLLMMRIALILLLALAFANPFVYKRSGALARRVLTVIAIDRSFSMHCGNRMSDAKAIAHRIVDGLPGTSSAQVVVFDSRVQAVAQSQAGKSTLNAAIDTLEAGDDVSSYGELTHSLRIMAQTAGMHLDAHVITDAQQTSMPASFTDLQVGPNISLVIQRVGAPGVANWAVEGVSVPARVYASARPRLNAVIAGWQGKNASRKVSLEIDGRTLASTDVMVPENGRAQVEFNSWDVPHGFHRGYVRIQPHDDLPQDDSFAFSIERSDPRPVLFLYAGGRSREAFFYQAALAAANSGLTVQSYPIEGLSGQELHKYAFVVLNDPGLIDPMCTEQLALYVSKGGALLITVGPRTTRAGELPVAGNSVSATEHTQGVGNVDSASRALAASETFQNVEFVRTARLIPKPNSRVIARFADGSPLLIEQAAGEGRILVFASTLDNSTSDFPLHSSFLPFVEQSGAYLSGADEDPSSVVVGTPVTLRRTNAQLSAADVIGPEGTRLLSLNDATRAMSYDLDREGFYEVSRANGHRALIAVHADRRESNLTQIPPDTLALWRNTGDDAAEKALRNEEHTVPRSLWRYALMLALLAAFVESILGMRYLTERQTE